MEELPEIVRKIKDAKEELAQLNARREELLEEIERLESKRQTLSNKVLINKHASVTNASSQEAKITLFRSLFRGREDVYARRFESAKTGKQGYQPACRNEWIAGVCDKPKMKCHSCKNRDLLALDNNVIRNHLRGIDPEDRSGRDFTIGIYPLLSDDTCWFLAVDFDKRTWVEDALSFLETCKAYNIPAALERSRSGKGGHVWIFFTEPVAAVLARKMGVCILTATMDNRPEIGLESYDRLFPNQDTMPRGGFGNLIALPLQKKSREEHNSVFVDENMSPYPDQWGFLSGLERMKPHEVAAKVAEAERQGHVLGIRTVITEDSGDEMPWEQLPSRRIKEPTIAGPLPQHINLVLGNQIYIGKEDLPPGLKNRLIRLAAFQNPAFYEAQAMRMPIYNKPRIICCAEDFSRHIGLPRGLLGDVVDLLRDMGIETEIIDERFSGRKIKVRFNGVLRPGQKEAALSMLAYDTGVLSATTAFGKTVIAAYMIARRGVNTLILVHRRQLLDQWVDRLSRFLGLDKKGIGCIGGGKRRVTGKIDVALIQSLGRKGVVDDIVGDYGHLVVDECHHISARSFEIVCRQAKARYVTGLSATPMRRDGCDPIIFMQCGPVRYRVDARKYAADRPFLHRVIVRKTGFKLPIHYEMKESIAIQDIYSALITDDERNNMIIDDILLCLQAKRSPVVLTERREHLELLNKRLEPMVKHLIVLSGGMGQKQRHEITEKLASIPDDEERLIIATGRYLGEGFDDRRLDTLFLAMPVSWRGVITQYAGRLHRDHDMKREVIIYDYADFMVPALSGMYKRRCKGYRMIGYEIEEPGYG